MFDFFLDCTQCSGGKYCAYPNATSESGPCDAGYFCRSGSNQPKPESGHTGDAGPCPAGKYCPQSTTNPLPCSKGRFSNNTHLKTASECDLCTPGHYCGEDGLANVSGQCDPGFYCLYGSSIPNPPVANSSGGPCPVGHYCLKGTSYPVGCKAGTYNNQTGQSQCQQCCSGYYCPENSTSCVNECPTGHYCPVGTRHLYEYPCPAGTYNAFAKKTDVSDCTYCDAGRYCPTAGLSASFADCAAGWYCRRGASSSRPIDIGNMTCAGNATQNASTCFCPNSTTGGQCAPGTFCPKGSSGPTQCSPGMYEHFLGCSLSHSMYQDYLFVCFPTNFSPYLCLSPAPFRLLLLFFASPLLT